MNEPTAALLAACRALARESRHRHRPSPSSIGHCTRQNWFSETGVAVTEEPDAESYIAAESGRLTEQLLTNIVNASSLGRIQPLSEQERELSSREYRPLNLRGGQFDQLMFTVRADGADDDLVLVEYKRKSVYNFLDIVRQGAREGAPDDYQQVQVLLAAKRLTRCLYIVANWDRAALTRACRGKERPPGVYAEWIVASPASVLASQRRAAMQLKYITGVTDAAKVPRDYNPHGVDADWQCKWCSWRTACLRAEGVTRKPGKLGDS